ncbi:MAG: aminopeptidase P family N-terminal domain-containing protein, partial [Clostridia bacterium]|nr:aminopeptidase P family N-terminal domain-containing protein [Clostridia bacterium]
MITDRINNIKKALPDNTAALVTNEADCFYLSGFLRSEGMVLITKNSAVLLVDFRYIEAAKAACRDIDVKLTSSFLKDVYALLKEQNIKTVFVQGDFVTLNKKAEFDKAFCGVEVSLELDVDKIIGDMRAV